MNSIFTKAYSITIKQRLSRISSKKVTIIYLIKCQIYSGFQKSSTTNIFLIKFRVKLFLLLDLVCQPTHKLNLMKNALR